MGGGRRACRGLGTDKEDALGLGMVTPTGSLDVDLAIATEVLVDGARTHSSLELGVLGRRRAVRSAQVLVIVMTAHTWQARSLEPGIGSQHPTALAR